MSHYFHCLLRNSFRAAVRFPTWFLCLLDTESGQNRDLTGKLSLCPKNEACLRPIHLLSSLLQAKSQVLIWRGYGENRSCGALCELKMATISLLQNQAHFSVPCQIIFISFDGCEKRPVVDMSFGPSYAGPSGWLSPTMISPLACLKSLLDFNMSK